MITCKGILGISISRLEGLFQCRTHQCASPESGLVAACLLGRQLHSVEAHLH